MKRRILLIFSTASAVLMADAPPNTTVSASAPPAMLARQSTAAFSPFTHLTDQEKSEPGEAPVALRRYTVEGSRGREILRLMGEKDQKEKAEQFTLNQGGTLYKSRRMDAGVSKAEELLPKDAKYKDKKPMVKFDLMHLRF